MIQFFMPEVEPPEFPPLLASSAITHWWILGTLLSRDGLTGPVALLPRISTFELAVGWLELTHV